MPPPFGAADGQTKLWDLVAGERRGTIPPAAKELTSAGFLGIGDQALIGSADGAFRVLDAAGAVVRAFAIPAGDHVHNACLTPDGSTLVCATQSGTLYVWDVAHGKLLQTLPAPKPE